MMMDFEAMEKDIKDPNLTADDLRGVALRFFEYYKELIVMNTKAKAIIKRKKVCIYQQSKVINVCEDTLQNVLKECSKVRNSYEGDLKFVKSSIQNGIRDVDLALKGLQMYDLDETISYSHLRFLEKLKRKGQENNTASTSQFESNVNKSQKKRNDYSSVNGKRGRKPKSKSDIEDDNDKPRKPRGRPPGKKYQSCKNDKIVDEENSESELKLSKKKKTHSLNENAIESQNEVSLCIPRKRQRKILGENANESQIEETDFERHIPRKRKKKSMNKNANESQIEETDFERQFPRKRRKKSLFENATESQIEETDFERETPRKKRKKRRILDKLREKSMAVKNMLRNNQRRNAQKDAMTEDSEEEISEQDISLDKYDVLVSKCMDKAANPEPVIVLQDVLKESYSCCDLDRDIIEMFKYTYNATETSVDENCSGEKILIDDTVSKICSPEMVNSNEDSESNDEYCQHSILPKFE